MRSVAVPDEVWARLDPSAGRLSRRDRRRVIAACAAFIALIALVVAGFIIGVINPDVYGSLAAGRDNTRDHTIDLAIRIDNNSDVDQHISSVAISAPGVRTAEPIRGDFMIPSHDHHRMVLRLIVTDCSAVRPHDEIVTRLVLDRFWGHHTQTLKWNGGLGTDGPAGDAWRACH